MAMGNNIQFHFNSVTNWHYQLQRRNTLDGSSVWVNVGAPVTGTGSVLIFSDSVTNVTQFYRVLAQ